MAERTVEHAARAVAALPDHGHDRALDPFQMVTTETGCGQNFVGGIDMHVILLRPIGKIANSLHHLIVRPRNIDRVVNDLAWMGNPLPAYHELVVRLTAEGVAHLAVEAGQANA